MELSEELERVQAANVKATPVTATIASVEEKRESHTGMTRAAVMKTPTFDGLLMQLSQAV